jgi:hypothetical protein
LLPGRQDSITAFEKVRLCYISLSTRAFKVWLAGNHTAARRVVINRFIHPAEFLGDGKNQQNPFSDQPEDVEILAITKCLCVFSVFGFGVFTAGNMTVPALAFLLVSVAFSLVFSVLALGFASSKKIRCSP